MADFVNLGGLAGTCALIWQLVNFSIEQYRRPRLKSLGPVPFPVPNFMGRGETFQVIGLDIENKGRKAALGCVARAKAISVSGQMKDVSLHWADTDFLEQEVGIPVNIAPDGKWRLDVAFSQSGRRGCWLATQRALSGKYSDDAELGEGEYTLKIWVTITCDNGNKVKSLLHLHSSQGWNRLGASGPKQGYLTRGFLPAGGRREGLRGKIGFARP
jgi:hypothetical protein